jgi:hypothetical protein
MFCALIHCHRCNILLNVLMCPFIYHLMLPIKALHCITWRTWNVLHSGAPVSIRGTSTSNGDCICPVTEELILDWHGLSKKKFIHRLREYKSSICELNLVIRAPCHTLTTSAKKISLSVFFIILSDQSGAGQEIPIEVIKLPEVWSAAEIVSVAEQKKSLTFL